ncbi:MAG: hypothetical protein II022_04275, partial [Muribaculaceae bacterium]|nr:hypothetical protein [Muribaculaceae bacterium]
VMKDLAVKRANVYLHEHRELSQAEENSIVFTNGFDGKKKSKKGDFGYVYQEGNEFFIVLNFQIRFR